jgi:hypothetical protein
VFPRIKGQARGSGSQAGIQEDCFGVPLRRLSAEERISEFQKLKTEGVASGPWR